MSEADPIKVTPPTVDPIFAIHSAAMREASEPRDGIKPTPVSYIIMCFFWILWGGWYMGYYSGEFKGNGLNERAVGGPRPAGPPQNPMVLGKEVFGPCIQCHQESGLGVAGSYPPLVGSEYVLGDKRRLVAILLKGITGEFVVKGATYNSEMPNWSHREDEELAAVATYIRASWGNKADAVSTEFVAAIRKELGDKGGWKAKTLAEFAESKPAVAPVAAPAAAPAPAPAAAAPAK